MNSALHQTTKIAQPGLPTPVFDQLYQLSKSVTTMVRSYFRIRRQQKIDRLAFDNMLSLSDEILRDIGVDREDVLQASRLPLSQSASKYLQKTALLNRQGYLREYK